MDFLIRGISFPITPADILKARPVRKRWWDCGDRLMCLNTGRAEQSAPAAMRQVAA